MRWRSKVGLAGAWVLLAAAAGPLMSQEPTLRVGVIKYKTVEAVTDTYPALFDYVARKVGASRAEVSILTPESLAEMQVTPGEKLAFDLDQGNLDLGVFTIFPYLEATRPDQYPDLEVFASHLVAGADAYQGTFVVRADSSIEHYADLSGKRFTFTKGSSTSGHGLPRGILEEHGVAFTETPFSGGHRASLDALVAGETDAVAVDRAHFEALEPATRGLLRELAVFDVPYHAYVFSPAIDASRRVAIEDAMLGAHRDPQARRRLDNPLRVGRWVPKTDDHYNELRRYLRFARVKPSLGVTIEPGGTTGSDQKITNLLGLLRSDVRTGLVETKRFSSVVLDGSATRHAVRVTLFGLEETYSVRLELDGEACPTGCRADGLSWSDLESGLATWIANQTLGAMPLTDNLLSDGTRWFITHGRHDGLESTGYTFFLLPEQGAEIQLAADAVEEITDTNTFFRADRVSAYPPGTTIQARFAAPGTPLGGGVSSHRDSGPLDDSGKRGWMARFFDRDQLLTWEVFGLIGTVIAAAVGAWLSRRKHRRFRNLLGDLHQVLGAYVEGKYDLDSRLIEQRERIDRLLEKGQITENQFLIVKHRLEEVDGLIKRLFAGDAVQPEGMRDEVKGILRGGNVTEKEFGQLLALVRKYEGQTTMPFVLPEADAETPPS